MLHELGNLYEFAPADGAFYLFAKAPWGTGSEFVAEAIKNDLLIIPGNVFSDRDTHFRISYAAEHRTLERGVEVLRNWRNARDDQSSSNRGNGEIGASRLRTFCQHERSRRQAIRPRLRSDGIRPDTTTAHKYGVQQSSMRQVPPCFGSRSDCLAFGGRPAAARAGDWPQWRGPAGNSTSDETGLPTHWSENENIAWKTPLPEWGTSTPAIFGDAIFVTSESDGALLCLANR